MKERHEKLHGDVYLLENSEGQRSTLSCRNGASPRCPSLSSRLLSDESLDALRELGGVLKKVHKRMVLEGYQLMDGVISKRHAKTSQN